MKYFEFKITYRNSAGITNSVKIAQYAHNVSEAKKLVRNRYIAGNYKIISITTFKR